MTDIQQFINYCMDFYGPKGIYPLGFTPEQIRLATELYRSTDREFCGDTVDREAVRDIILAATQHYMDI